jgi:hypothetical protein
VTELARTDSPAAVSVGEDSELEKSVRGKDGWLFLGNDTNDTLGQQSGRVSFSEHELNSWQHVLESRIGWLERLGRIPYLFMVPPNAHSVYPEKLPDGVTSSPDRLVMQLLRHLAGKGSFARAIYPLDELLRAKAERPVFSPTNSHWNGHGAFVGYSVLAEEIERLAPLRRVAVDDVLFSERLHEGDLGGKLDPPERSVLVHAEVREPTFRQLSDNRVMNNGRLAVFECPDAPPTRCLAFGDCHVQRMVPFMAQSFGRFVFAHNAMLDFELVREEQPDVVVTVECERFLKQIPCDVPAPTTRELAQGKIERGLVVDFDLPGVSAVRA